ncbi:MAG: glycerol-3-phosphate 1-O-acyltransferase PlsY [Phycisphaera sp.]|nr:glycerol-3-phosphate 1-O-acyltransferase PlsY [Phycisphaera sp.]
MSQQTWWLWMAGAYLCGSVPFGLLIGLAHGVDIRKRGSGNVGATNAGRVLGKKWGILCFVLDVLKGAGPVLACGISVGFVSQAASITPVQAGQWLAVAACAMLGHIFPVWLYFKGGKGVATGLGVMLGIYPTLTWPAMAAFVTWVVVVKLSKMVSLASIVAAALLPIYVLVTLHLHRQPIAQAWPFPVVAAVLAALTILRHRTNIARILAGTESKIGKKH